MTPDEGNLFVVNNHISYGGDAFDYETQKTYKVTVTVNDGQLVSLPEILTINVIDCNDPPLADYPERVSLMENVPRGTLIAKVNY